MIFYNMSVRRSWRLAVDILSSRRKKVTKARNMKMWMSLVAYQHSPGALLVPGAAGHGALAPLAPRAHLAVPGLSESRSWTGCHDLVNIQAEIRWHIFD